MLFLSHLTHLVVLFATFWLLAAAARLTGRWIFDRFFPIISLFSGSSATAAVYRPDPGIRPLEVAQGSVHPSAFSRQVLPGFDMPLISTVLALIFSSIIAFNLALLRHLRRVNASSRRGAWKEG